MTPLYPPVTTPDTGPAVVHDRVVEVEGVRTTALCAQVSAPKAVLVALHGGATSGRYFDCPGHPQLSLLRAGAALGYTVLAPERPGYGSSAPEEARFDSPQERVDSCFDAIDALLDGAARGAGVFLVGHSAGCDLAARMAADPRGAGLLGVELAGTGEHKHLEATRVIAAMRPGRSRAAIREMLWGPERLYPADIVGGRSLTVGTPRYEVDVVNHWPGEFPGLAGRIRIPVRFTHGEYERVWRSDAATLAEIRTYFAAAPRCVTHIQSDCGHNLSVGHGAAAYHLGLLTFVEECIGDRVKETDL